MSRRSESEMVAYALEMDASLLDFAPHLLADLDVLGADDELIVEVLRAVGVTERSTVIDLGSGKGGVSIAIAAELGCSVLGIELFEPFIEIASDAAVGAGVADRCRFVHGNIESLVQDVDSADAVVYAALGDVLGPLDATVASIRRYAAPGGHVLVNDSFLLDATAATIPGFEHYADLAETRRRLTACGDVLVVERFEAPEDPDSGASIDEMSLLAARAEELGERHPEFAPALREFVDAQRVEYDFLAQATAGAVWALRRS